MGTARRHLVGRARLTTTADRTPSMATGGRPLPPRGIGAYCGRPYNYKCAVRHHNTTASGGVPIRRVRIGGRPPPHHAPPAGRATWQIRKITRRMPDQERQLDAYGYGAPANGALTRHRCCVHYCSGMARWTSRKCWRGSEKGTHVVVEYYKKPTRKPRWRRKM